MSIHTERSMVASRAKGGTAGQEVNRDLWKWSKRELIECALHLAAATTDEYEDALEDGRARSRLIEERNNLKDAGIL